MTRHHRTGARARRRLVLLVVGLALAAGLAPAADAARARGAAPIGREAWAEIAKGASGRVWIHLRAQADLRAASRIADWDERGRAVQAALMTTAARTQGGLLRMLAARGVHATPFWIVNAIALDGADAATVRLVAARSEVGAVEGDPKAWIEPDAGAGITAKPGGGTGGGSVEWGVSSIRADQVWSGYGTRGEGIVVATIDTGVLYTHTALVGSYRGALGGGSFNHDYSWYDPTGTCTAAPCDNNGHGTHTMGTIAGSGGIGVAPGVRWIAAKGCSTSSCSSTDLLAAGQWILAPTRIGGRSGDATKRPHLVSNSWGSSSGSTTTFQKMVDNWVAAGIVPVFANGNAGPGCGTVGAPGSYLNAIGVGAYDASGKIASFSSRGPTPFSTTDRKPEISAPGVSVRSSWNDGGYNTISGTSMATPHVAGMVALMLAAAPALVGAIDQVKTLIGDTANRSGTGDTSCGGNAGDNNVWGRGKADAYAAVTAAPRGSTGTLAGTVVASGSGSGIGGATVTLSGASSRTLTADASGAFSAVVSTGSYTVSASAFGYVTGSAPATVSTGATTSVTVTLGAAPTYTLGGTVTGPGGAPIAGATVATEIAAVPVVTTGADGRYAIANLPAGTYVLTVTPPDRCINVTAASVTLSSSTEKSFSLTARTDGAGRTCTTGAAAFVAGTTKLALTGDDAIATIALPFTYSYYGSNWTSATVSTNGWLSFPATTTAAFSNTQIPTTSDPNGIFPLWADLVVDSKAAVYTGVTGSAPNRRFVVEWRNVTFFSDTGRATFGVIISESGSEIVLEYGSLSGTGSRGEGATVGIEKYDGRTGLQYSYAEPTLSSGWAITFR